VSERESLLEARIATVTLTFASGHTLLRSYRMDEPWPAWMDEPPAFLTDLAKDWPVPNEPIQFTANVEEGHEQDARDLLGYE
jgi:hypothetical protein